MLFGPKACVAQGGNVDIYALFRQKMHAKLAKKTEIHLNIYLKRQG